MKNNSSFLRALTVAAIALVLYAPSLLTGIVNDDVFNYLNASRSGWSFSELSRSFYIDPHRFHEGIVPDCLDLQAQYFRPLIVASFKLDTVLFGGSYNWYHLQSVILAVLTAMMAYYLAVRLMPDESGAFLATLFFIAAPVNFFTVYWISARTDLLCAFFMMISLLLFMRFLDNDSASGRVAAFSVSILFFIVSLLAKEASMVMPVLVFLLTFAASPKTVVRKAALYSLVYLAVFSVYFVIRTNALGGVHYPSSGFYAFPVNDPMVVYYCLQKYVWTFLTLAFFVVPFPIKMFFYDILYNVIFMGALVFSVFVIRKFTRQFRLSGLFRILIAAAAASLAPTLPLIPGPHYCYIPSMFFCMALALVIRYEYRGSEWHAVPDYPRAKKAYLALYAVAGLVYAFLFLVMNHFGSAYNEKACAMLEKAYDEYRASEYYGKTKEPPAFFLFDIGGSPMMFDEFKLRRPEKSNFKGFIMNFGAFRRSAVDIGTGEVTVRAADMPLLSGIIEEFACSGRFDFAPGMRFKCKYYEMVVTKTALNAWTGCTGIAEFKIIFDEKTCPPESRIFLDAHMGSMSDVIGNRH